MAVRSGVINGAGLSQGLFGAGGDGEVCHGVGDWLKVEHGGFEVRADMASRARDASAATFSVSGVAEEVDKDVVSFVYRRC